MAVPGLWRSTGNGKPFVTEALTLEAIKALNKAKKYKPTLLPVYVSIRHPCPIDKDKRFYDKYKKKA